MIIQSMDGGTYAVLLAVGGAVGAGVGAFAREFVRRRRANGSNKAGEQPTQMWLEVFSKQERQAEKRHDQMLVILNKIVDSNNQVHVDMVRILERLK